MSHIALYKAAQEAIERVFSDRSVPVETTRESLEELSELIADKLELLDVE